MSVVMCRMKLIHADLVVKAPKEKTTTQSQAVVDLTH